MRRTRSAFTLIELLVVIAIIALLVSILLPSLARARRTAIDLKCQVTQRSLGQAIQLYLDDQKDPVWFDTHPRSRLAFDHWNVVYALKDYVAGGDTGGPAFICPAAVGELSVKFPETAAYLASGGRIFTVPDAWDDTHDDDEVREYTEYWFNDSYWERTAVPESGVSGRPLRGIPHPDALVWLTDAYNEAPRHYARNTNYGTRDRQLIGKNHYFFGDHHIESLSYGEADEFSPDRYGAPGPYYNWGHFYPNR